MSDDEQGYLTRRQAAEALGIPSDALAYDAKFNHPPVVRMTKRGDRRVYAYGDVVDVLLRYACDSALIVGAIRHD